MQPDVRPEVSVDPPAAPRHAAPEQAAEPGPPEASGTPPVPVPGGAGRDAADLADRLDRIDTALTVTAESLRGAGERAAARERVIDRQHAEIERLRGEARTGVLRPVVTDLCRLRNDLLRQAATIPDTATVAQLRGLLGSFADSVAEALERCGVEPMGTGVGEPFAPQRHRVASVRPTGDPAADGTVAEVLADGYAEPDSGRTVAPARVVVARVETPEPAATPEPTTTPESTAEQEHL